jgi:hypothetical protein
MLAREFSKETNRNPLFYDYASFSRSRITMFTTRERDYVNKIVFCFRGTLIMLERERDCLC